MLVESKGLPRRMAVLCIRLAEPMGELAGLGPGVLAKIALGEGSAAVARLDGDADCEALVVGGGEKRRLAKARASGDDRLLRVDLRLAACKVEPARKRPAPRAEGRRLAHAIWIALRPKVEDPGVCELVLHCPRVLVADTVGIRRDLAVAGAHHRIAAFHELFKGKRSRAVLWTLQKPPRFRQDAVVDRPLSVAAPRRHHRDVGVVHKSVVAEVVKEEDNWDGLLRILGNECNPPDLRARAVGAEEHFVLTADDATVERHLFVDQVGDECLRRRGALAVHLGLEYGKNLLAAFAPLGQCLHLGAVLERERVFKRVGRNPGLVVVYVDLCIWVFKNREKLRSSENQQFKHLELLFEKRPVSCLDSLDYTKRNLPPQEG